MEETSIIQRVTPGSWWSSRDGDLVQVIQPEDFHNRTVNDDSCLYQVKDLVSDKLVAYEYYCETKEEFIKKFYYRMN